MYEKQQIIIIKVNGKEYAGLVDFSLGIPIYPVLSTEDMDEILGTDDNTDEDELIRRYDIYDKALFDELPQEDQEWKYRDPAGYFEHYQNSDEWKNLNIDIHFTL